MASSTAGISVFTSRSSKTFPEISCVSVFFPSSIFARYSLSVSVSMSHSFVPLPKQTGSTPTASGSKVPVWPIFFCLRIPLNLATTSWDVKPASLYMFIIPLYIRFPRCPVCHMPIPGYSMTPACFNCSSICNDKLFTTS